MSVHMRILLLLGTLAVSLAACSPEPSDAALAPVNTGVAPTEAERRAAALLSLSNNSTLEAKKDPYQLAVACLVALDGLQERMVEFRALDDEKKNALRQARTLYERKAAAARGGSARELAGDIEAGREASEDAGLQAQIAVSCLRKLI